MKKRSLIKVYGHVQGVNFRSFVYKSATELQLTGFVHNEEDGTVVIEAEGEEEKLHELLKVCTKGPTYAQVEKIEHEFSEMLKDYSEFRFL